mmetsp:Transcript_8028/g.30044  ORF Transcript_8028/g.30044 Transcript_8028/m.30044 type:complete len:260 (-) Transcript_8028:1385-2164(-)
MSVSAATRSSVSTETSHMLHRGALAAPAARCRGSRSILSNSSAVVVGAGALVVFFAKPGPPSTPVLKSPATIFPTSSSANHFSFVSTRVETNTISTTVHCSAYFSFENPAAVAAVAATLPSTGAPIGVTSTVTRVTPPGGVIPLALARIASRARRSRGGSTRTAILASFSPASRGKPGVNTAPPRSNMPALAEIAVFTKLPKSVHSGLSDALVSSVDACNKSSTSPNTRCTTSMDRPIKSAVSTACWCSITSVSSSVPL